MKQTLRVPGEESCWLLCSPCLPVTGEVDTAVWHLERALRVSSMETILGGPPDQHLHPLINTSRQIGRAHV